MVKSSLIVGVITFILVIIGGLLSSVCCLASPVLGILLGLAAGFLCAVFEKPAESEKAAVRGAIAGAIAGGVGLVAQFIGQMIGQLILGGNVACIPGMCSESAAPISQTSVTLFAVFNSCFSGLILLAIMAGLGAVGGVLWLKTKPRPKSPAGPSANPAAG
ncbi:MAG: hypothetical protein WBM17_10970 [Anaerolineales bacterium]